MAVLTRFRRSKSFLAATPPEQVRPPKFINGDDLIAMGFKPGPTFQMILTAVEDAQLEGALQTKDQAVSYVRRNYANSGNGR